MQLPAIQPKIHEARGQKVMLDFDLAELFEVETRSLNQAVKRNLDIFPEDFMFRLTLTEWESMSSQNVMTYPSSKRPKTALPLQKYNQKTTQKLSDTKNAPWWGI